MEAAAVPEPVYQQIAGDLRRKILTGALPPGARLPSRKQLAEAWRVSDKVPLQAVGLLVAEGLVETRHGAGSFVRARPERRQVHCGPAGTVSARPATGPEAEQLGIRAGATLLVVTRESGEPLLLPAETTEVVYGEERSRRQLPGGTPPSAAMEVI
jgi:DNA-binding GntR family transcriptional regulator